MRARWTRRWGWKISAIVLVGGVLSTGWGLGVTSAAPPPSNPGNPFHAILDKLDQILTKLNGSASGNHTLRWDSNLTGAARFTTAFTGAVLDNNTGLVWEQAPDATLNGHTDWRTARSECVNRNVGGTRGWRLPSMAELSSLIDPSLAAPFVPASVFSGVRSAQYWSATAATDFQDYAWVVNFFGNGEVYIDSKGHSFQVWCVRGGMNADAY